MSKLSKGRLADMVEDGRSNRKEKEMDFPLTIYFYEI